MARTSPAGIVSVVFDERPVDVPAGTPLVVAAAEAGVEIPVFCYEPRLGPAIGACRMCLVEVEQGGRAMPKLQAACTLAAQDGMVVRTAATSAKAREGQDGVLEFLLLNHPLDCPVCDKGGECPLQDLTFRYGPSSSRMTLPKRTYEKPLAISPSILLDRERCILCYRCTRFSSDVSEDGELIARERGAFSVIATFQEQPYRGVFSGNVTELCPVGALLPTAYRFRARPWEIINIPTVCQGCPTGCNTWLTVREGHVERVLSRNHPAVDEGWLCDRGRFAPLVAPDAAPPRITRPEVRSAAGGDEVELADAALSVAQRLRHLNALRGAGVIAIATGGDLTNEEAYGWSRIAEALEAITAASPVARHADWPALEPYAARISDLDHADVICVVGDADIADRAGVVDLRVRRARRRGATLLLSGCGGTMLEPDASDVEPVGPGSGEATLAALAAGQHRFSALIDAATCPVIIITDPVASDVVAAGCHRLRLHERGGVIVFADGANERGAARAGLAGGADAVLAAIEAGSCRGLVLIDVDPLDAWPEPDRWRAALGRLECLVSVASYRTATVELSHVILPHSVWVERDGTTTNTEGRLQRMRPGLVAPSGVSDLALLARIGEHLGIALHPHASSAYRALAQARGLELSYAALNGRAPLPPRPSSPPPRPATANPSRHLAATDQRFVVVAPRPLFAGPSVEHNPLLRHQRAAWVMLNHADADRLGASPGDIVAVRGAGFEHTGPLRTSRRLVAGAVRINHPRRVSGEAQVTRAHA